MSEFWALLKVWALGGRPLCPPSEPGLTTKINVIKVDTDLFNLFLEFYVEIKDCSQ